MVSDQDSRQESQLLCPAGFPVPPGTEEWVVLKGPRGEAGPKGDKGEPGPRGLTGRTARAIVALFLVGFLVAAANLLFTVHYVHVQQAAQQQAGRVVERSICKTLDSLAALRPPAGNPAANPSRAYDDELHATLDGLGPDLGCR